MTHALRILVCDDNVDGAETMGLWLSLERHEVQVVYTGPDALEAARTRRPDVVLLDLNLSRDMDGFELARRLRSDPSLAGVLLVAVTGRDHEDDRRRSREAGVDVHLLKPAPPAQLREILARATPRPTDPGASPGA